MQGPDDAHLRSREPSQRIQEAQVRLTAVPYEMRLDEAGSLRDMRQGAQRASDEARGITVSCVRQGMFERKTRREAAERRLREEIRNTAMLCCCRGLLHAAQLRPALREMQQHIHNGKRHTQPTGTRRGSGGEMAARDRKQRQLDGKRRGGERTRERAKAATREAMRERGEQNVYTNAERRCCDCVRRSARQPCCVAAGACCMRRN